MTTADEIRKFAAYCARFYLGPDAVYPLAGLTIEALTEACTRRASHPTWGFGDSIDREAVRRDLEDRYGYTETSPTITVGPLTEADTWLIAHALDRLAVEVGTTDSRSERIAELRGRVTGAIETARTEALEAS